MNGITLYIHIVLHCIHVWNCNCLYVWSYIARMYSIAWKYIITGKALLILQENKYRHFLVIPNPLQIILTVIAQYIVCSYSLF